MCTVGDNLFCTEFFQRFGGLTQGSGGIDHIVDQYTGTVFNITDDVHHFGNVGFRATLIDDGEAAVERLAVRPRPLHTAGIRRDDHGPFARQLLSLQLLLEDRSRKQVVEGDVEEALNLPGVQLDGEHPRRPGRAEEIRGKIVLFDVPMPEYDEAEMRAGYGDVVGFRVGGPAAVGAAGAIAMLLRSLTNDADSPPHTGMTRYEDDGPRIPAAAITVPDAERLHRMVDAGETVRVRLSMEAHDEGTRTSHNVIAEIPGTEAPDEYVIFGGHIDSWDVGQGAMDDGGGCVISMEALRLVRELGLRPRRTLRVVLWTNEENGTRGAKEYRASRVGDPARHFAAIESDGGVEAPWGFGVSVWENDDKDVDVARQDRVIDVVREIGRFLRSVDADSVRAGGGGADISPLMKQRVPGLALRTPMEEYWDIHHTHADTVDKVDPVALRKNVAAMAVMGYLLADLPGNLD